jgi:hypothetical protein
MPLSRDCDDWLCATNHEVNWQEQALRRRKHMVGGKQSDGNAKVKRAGEAFSQPPLSPALVQHLLYNPRQA